MTEDIKEILDKLSNRKQETLIQGLRECQLKDIEHPFITREEYIDKILDYIKNLQQKDFESQKEITKLKDKLEQQRKEYQDTYKDVRVEIKEKNERIVNLQQENEYLEHIINNLKDNNNRLEEIIHDTDIVLEQENKKLKEELKNRPIVDFTYDVYKELEDYKSRCEKAIEYIKENYPTSTINYQDDKYKLINILNGSDEK